MVKELQSIGRSVGTSTQNVSAGNAFETLGQAAGQLGTLVSSKLAAVAVEQATQKGALDATEGKVPENLALPFTAATKAYNDAASKVEADRMITSAHAQVSEALVNATNPATFNRNTPAEFHAQLEGILQGTLENTRPENRAEVSSSMLKLSNQASLQMLEHSIKFDNQQTLANFKADTSNIETQLKNAYIAGDAEQIKALTERYQDTVANYSELNQQIKAGVPALKQKFQNDMIVNEQLGKYAQALSENRGPQFLADFARNVDGLTFEQRQEAAKALIDMNASSRKLTMEQHAEANAQVEQGIVKGTITTPEQIEQYPDLTALQHIENTTKLYKKQQADFKNQANVLQAQKDIMQGNAQDVKPAVADEMYNNWRSGFQDVTGQAPNIYDAWNSWQGKGSFPLSGINNVPYGRDIPEFNQDMTAQLTNHDPMQIVQAASLFRAMNLEAQRNNYASPVVLKGDALDVASAFNTLDRGGLDDQARLDLAKRINDSVFNASEPEREIRRQRANTFTAKQKDMEAVYEKKFGEKFVPGLSDATMGVMKQNLKLSIMNTGMPDAAVQANNFLMKDYRGSEWYPEGMVSTNAPENLPISNVGNAFQNQLGTRVQLLINSNAEYRKTLGVDEVPFKIEFKNPKEQSIDLSSELTDEEKVFGNMSGKLKTFRQRSQEALEKDLPEIAEATGEKAAPAPKGKIPVRINNFDTEIYLQPTPESSLGNRPSYALFYTDQTGQPQPVPDINSPDNVARFNVEPLGRWAPSIYEGERSESIKAIAIKAERERALAELEQLKEAMPKGDAVDRFIKEPLIKLITPGGEMGDVLRLMKSDPEKAQKFAEALDGKNPEEAIRTLRKRLGDDIDMPTPEEKAAKADNVGIAANAGEVK
jgi:hypothetical protein